MGPPASGQDKPGAQGGDQAPLKVEVVEKKRPGVLKWIAAVVAVLALPPATLAATGSLPGICAWFGNGCIDPVQCWVDDLHNVGGDYNTQLDFARLKIESLEHEKAFGHLEKAKEQLLRHNDLKEDIDRHIGQAQAIKPSCEPDPKEPGCSNIALPPSSRREFPPRCDRKETDAFDTFATGLTMTVASVNELAGEGDLFAQNLQHKDAEDRFVKALKTADALPGMWKARYSHLEEKRRYEALAQREGVPPPTRAPGIGPTPGLPSTAATVPFEPNSSRVSDRDIAAIKITAHQLNSLRFRTMQIKVVGKTDENGTAKANLELSIERARSLRELFVAAGVDPSRIYVEAVGEAWAKKGANDEEEALDRAGEIRVVDPEATTTTFTEGSPVVRDRDFILKIAERLRQSPDLIVILEGHADESGTDDINEPLSEERAAAVEAELLKEHIPQSRIKKFSFGSRRSGLGEKYRRVDVSFR